MFQSLTLDNLSEKEIYDVVYNIFPFVEDFFLVEAYVVSKDKDGFFAHIKQKANESTVSAYNIGLDDSRIRLFQIIEMLQPAALTGKFKPPRKKRIELKDLLEDKELKRKIKKYVDRLMDELLAGIVKNDFALTWEVERRVLVKDFIVNINKEPLKPHLYFEKTPKNVNYRFELEGKAGKWSVNSKGMVAPITNNPAWLFVDFQLYKVLYVNGNMVKPFRNKNEVLIPTASVKTYFQKFILKVASKVEIEAVGFDFFENSKLVGCQIHLVRDFITHRWGIVLKMDYDSVDFTWNEKRNNKTSLNFSEEENIQIVKIVRNKEAEKKYIELIQSFGLENTLDSFFHLKKEEKDEFELLEWMIEQKGNLIKAGFQVINPILDNQSVNINKAELRFDLNQQNDWFDLYGKVIIGQFQIPFPDFANHIKELNRFFYLPNGELFIIPQEWMNKYHSLFKFGKKEENHIKLDKSQYMLIEELEEIGAEIEVEDLADFKFEVPKQLKATLRPYQLDGVKWLVRHRQNNLGACLADDMGLGKTLQTITVLLHAKGERAQQALEKPAETDSGKQLDLFSEPQDAAWLNALNVLVILPASLVFNWEREIGQFAPSLTVYKHTGPKRHKDIRLIKRFDVVLSTYQTILRDINFLVDMEFEYVVLDESQQIKNKDSKMFKAINQLNATHKISLSGTPIENSLSDLWAQMHFINPNLLGNYNFFRREFILPIEKKNDDEKKDRLRTLVKPYLLRRTKNEVAKELPPLTIRVFYSEMSTEQKKLYEKEKSAARNYLLEHFQDNNPKFRLQILQSLTKLRQLANHPKLVNSNYNKGSNKFNDVMDQWEVARKGNHKVLMFSSFVKHLELYKNAFQQQNEPYSWLTGSLESREREREISKFENNESVRSFFISIKSGGTGLNLVSADYVFILDPWWNPFTEQQAIARAHRIGQDKNVIAYKFITRNTIEEKILKLQEKKARLAEDIIENVQKGKLSKGDIKYLLD